MSMTSDTWTLIRNHLMADAGLATLMGGTVRAYREKQDTARSKAQTYVTFDIISETHPYNSDALKEHVFYLTAWAPKDSGDGAAVAIGDRLIRLFEESKPAPSGNAFAACRIRFDGNRPGVDWDDEEKMWRDDISFRAFIKHTD